MARVTIHFRLRKARESCRWHPGQGLAPLRVTCDYGLAFLYHRWVDIERPSGRTQTHLGSGLIFTIGHSNHPLRVFLHLLLGHGVNVLADIRSAPYSRFNPQFNRDPLAAELSRCGIEYRYFGRELGGRPRDPACHVGGRVRYDRVAKTERFRKGLARAVEAAVRYRVALMCAEREPLDCHRTLLVGRALDAQGVEVQHILADGTLENQADAMSRLLAQHHLAPQGDLLATREQSIAAAIAHRQSNP